jgi:hypothetical protein
MTQLLTWFKTVFSAYDYGHDLESFINSKAPQSTAEVEHWTRYYDNKLAWHRGL